MLQISFFNGLKAIRLSTGKYVIVPGYLSNYFRVAGTGYFGNTKPTYRALILRLGEQRLATELTLEINVSCEEEITLETLAFVIFL